MKKIRNTFLFIYFLSSSISWGQCVDVKFSSTTDPEDAFPGLPQRVCLAQCTTGTCASTTVYATVTSGTITSGSWEVVGGGSANVTPSSQTNTSCILTANVGSTPYDWGKARVVYRYNMEGTDCGCVDTLDLYKEMVSQTSPFFPPILGPTCLAEGAKGTFYVDPRFTRQQNLQLGFGVDGYTWSVLNDGTTGVGTWVFPPTSGNIASGDNSSVEITAPSSGWTNATATIRVVQGNTCNTFQTPLIIDKGNPSAEITVTSAPSPYELITPSSIVAYRLPTNSSQTITLEAPAGAVADYTWSTDQPAGFTLTPSGTNNYQCTVTPVSGSGARSGRITLTSPGCGGGGQGSSDFIEIRRTLISTPNSISQPSGCQNDNTNLTISVVNPPGGAPNVYEWSFSPTQTSPDPTWHFVGGTNGSSITVYADADAPAVTFSAKLNGQSTPLTASSPLGINGNQGYVFTMPSTFNVGSNNIRAEIITTDDFSPALPNDCIESNLRFAWSYTGGSNATLTSSNNACGASIGNVQRTTAGIPYGGGTLSVVITQTSCSTCSVQCLAVSGSTSVGTRARPSKGNGELETSETKQALNDLKVFPNPANEEISIEVDDFGDNDFIEVFDSSGKKVKALGATGKVTRVNVKNLKVGTFLVRYHGESNVISKTLIVR